MIVIIFLINGTITNDELRMPLSVIPNGVRDPVRIRITNYEVRMRIHHCICTVETQFIASLPSAAESVVMAGEHYMANKSTIQRPQGITINH